MPSNVTTVYCPASLRAQWPRPLAQAWYAQYPDLFDRDDLRLALSQPQNHFAEWFVAIHLFHRDGAYSLIEKYAYLRHDGKRHALASVLTPGQIALLDDMRRNFGVQPPDLFVFIPSRGGRFWFAEAKGPGDRLSAKQRQSHLTIAEKLRVPVEVFNVRICRGTAGNQKAQRRVSEAHRVRGRTTRLSGPA